MNPLPIDEPTAQFLEAAVTDLQGQIGMAGDVETIWVGQADEGIGLRARVRVGGSTIDLDGQGDSIVEAYSDLCRQAVVPMLAAAFRELVERYPRAG